MASTLSIKILFKNDRYDDMAEKVRELYRAFREAGFLGDEAFELTKLCLDNELK